MLIKKIKNNTDTPKTWVGQTIDPGEYYQIDTTNSVIQDKWEHNSELLIAIANAEAIVNDGDKDLTDVDEALEWLKANNEFQKTEVERAIKVSIYPPEGFGGTFVTHDWTDKTTWWGNSARVTDQVLANGGDNKRYGSPHGTWIDLFHGKVSYENRYQTGTEVIVKVDDVEVDSSTYVVDYDDGYITFNIAQDPSAVVTASYNYENGSTCTFVPEAGKVNRVVYTELQFTKDVEFTSPIAFQLWVYNPYDLPNKVPYGLPVIYNSMKDIINSSNMPTCSYLPVLKGFTREMIILPFNYFTTLDLKSSLGMELRLYLVQDTHTAVDGEFATLSIYYSEVDE